MFIDSSASMLSTQILNIIHEKESDLKDSRAIEETEGGSGSKPTPDKEKDSLFLKFKAPSGCGSIEKATETYKENGRFNKRLRDSDEEQVQQKISVDILV